jgi:hypothetical protein
MILPIDSRNGTICVIRIPDQLDPGDILSVVEFMEVLKEKSFVLNI